MTVNTELAVYKKIGQQHGITVVAGCPNAANLRELSACNECAWLDIEHSYEYLENLNFLGEKLITEEAILSRMSQSKPQTMEDLEAFIRKTRYLLPAGYFGTRYKPVYFLATED